METTKALFTEVTGTEKYKVVDLATGGECYTDNKVEAYKYATLIYLRGHNYRIEVRP